MASRIRTLVEGMTSRPIRSPYLDPLQARAAGKRSKGGLEAAQAEILREMADSYTRSQRRVDEAFAKLAALDAELSALETGTGAKRAECSALIAEFNEQRTLADRRLWELRVHRESLGFARDGRLRQEYPLPPKRR